MKTNLWVIIVVVSACVGFLIGYSTPPFIDAGVVGGGDKPAAAGAAPDVDKATEQYYKDLLKFDE